ncbi:GatB/YqeY domain-containing protein [Nocardiopsis changdeensis]|uniref:GatB/YqeY domain-containing protein n=1 Tax=Nocardiopsis changdeensis TaxID=2831969 RepID=A0ABX8BKZ4_9ACTN|nr:MULTISPECIES: GatB/YqeY domain-containing protein [Nocardiopsis]QUX22909.1 GatB/YqeY domain-containing protein [Nocardiopsis changdeensis]QYX38852.1 GatB/YqeY domain-containing protein [Nocardiopsis sp. MT53]
MSELKDRLKNDLTTAIKARDKVRTGTLRMVLAAISTEEAAGSSQRALGDDEVVKLLTREAKKRREAAEAFEKGGRPEQAEAERAESEVISDYLPKQLTDEELSDLVAAAVEEAGAQTPRDMGKVMKVLNPRIAGRAEGSRVAAEVKRRLAG